MQTFVACAISTPASPLFSPLPFLTSVNIRMAPTDRTPEAEEYEYYQVLGGVRINIYAFIHQPIGLQHMRNARSAQHRDAISVA
jgi:hypothetical protein